MSGGRHLDFEAFSENLEMARNIEERVVSSKIADPYRSEGFDRLKAFQNVMAIERYITGLYNDIKFNDAISSEGLCTGLASEAYLISLSCAPRYFREPEDINIHPIDKDVMTFVKKMGDAMAMNEIDLDLGSGRWTVSTDLLMDMLNALNVVSTAILIEVQEKDAANLALKVDMEYNVITGCTLVAAYAMIIYQCVKNGSYRGQTLSDVKHKMGKK
ncbi:MAG TPA: hypothetical protein VGK13_06385 [Methanocellaceae archaeon]|jgi:hypothetical protein